MQVNWYSMYIPPQDRVMLDIQYVFATWHGFVRRLVSGLEAAG